MEFKRFEILSTTDAFEINFKDCCRRYDHLDMYVAWVGNPRNLIPFQYLRELSSVHAVVGISLLQSHPDGVELLMGLDDNIRILNELPLFHPKIYSFSKDNDVALFIGSTNFTYSGFYKNIETNILIECERDSDQIKNHLEYFRIWETDEHSFVPSREWLSGYRRRYEERQNRIDSNRLKDESSKENEYALGASWLTHAGWNLFLDHLRPALLQHEATHHLTWDEKLHLLDTYKQVFRYPWSLALFDSIENRRMLNGLPPHAWLGHVGSSGHARHLLANSTADEKQIIVDAMNNIVQMQLPLDWNSLRADLQNLEALGSTMKVWSRYLTISRPDVFGTIASTSVRSNLATILNVSENYFATVDGYIHFMQRLHNSPWFNAPQPQDNFERAVWENRVALLDTVFY